MTIIVQVNGRVRGRLTAEGPFPEAEAVEQARALPGVSERLSGPARRVVYIPNRLVNFVTED